MRVADSDYILALHNGARVVNYAVFTLANGTILNLQPSDFRVTGNNYTDKTTDSSAFSVGSFIGKTANICIDNSDGRFDGYDFYMSRFLLRESIAIGNTVKHVAIGDFTVVTDYTPGSVISFSGVDATYKFDKAHNLTGTKTFKQIISLACTACLGSSTFDATGNFSLYNTSVDTSKLDAKLTWRQLVSYVAIACGYNAYIDATGLLKFKWYDTSVWHSDDLDGGTFDTNTTPYSDGDDADGGDFTFSESTDYDGGAFTDTDDYHIIQSYKNFQIGTYDISITGVRVINGETVVESTSSRTYGYSYVIEVKDNPLCEGRESTIASHLASKLLDFTFRIFSCDVSCDPLIEAGDMALVLDTKGIAHRTLINSVEFSTGGRTKIACQAESIIRQQSSYTSEAAKAVVEANRHTDDTLSSYDESVQRMNRLAQNATGLYDGRVKQSDGSYINYASDHQITYWPDGSARFVQHSFVAKETGGGYFYSTDSGTSDLGEYSGSIPTTWTGGLDKNGNAVLHTIAVYKLQANWIVAGILTDAYENNFWNLDTGEFALTNGAKVRYDDTDYSGAYTPTLNNAPANSWNTSELNEANVGKTFKNTTNDKDYVYVKTDIVYPQSDHPYSDNENKNYRFYTGLTAPIKIKFNENCKVENNYDYVEIIYRDNNSDAYKIRLSGEFGGQEVVVPSNQFWLKWHSDISQTYWGWAIDSVEATTDAPSTFESGEIPTSSVIVYFAYEWREITLEEFSAGISRQLIDESMTPKEIMYALTGGDQNQGIYYYDNKVYLNGEYIKANSLSADDIATGTMSADRIYGGALLLGGLNDVRGQLIAMGAPEVAGTIDITAGQSGGWTASPLIDGMLWINVTSTSAPSGRTCGTARLNSGQWVELYPGLNFIGYYTSISLQYNASYDYSAQIMTADALVRIDNGGVLAEQINAKGGYVGDLSLADGELYVRDEYDLAAKNASVTKKAKGINLKSFKPYRLYIKETSFKLVLDYSISTDVTNRTIQLLTQKYSYSSRTWTTLDTQTLENTEGNHSIQVNRTFYNDETDSYRIRITVNKVTFTSNFTMTTNLYINNVTKVSLSSDGVWGNFYGILKGSADLDNASIGDISISGMNINGDDSSSDAYFTFNEQLLSMRDSEDNYAYFDHNGIDCSDGINTEATITVNHDYMHVSSSNSRYARCGYSGLRLQIDTSNYCVFNRYEISSEWDGTSYYVDWIQGSDERIKEEIEPLNAELSKNFIDATEPKKFRYKSGGGKHYGMIAQQARKVLDDLGETDSVLEYGPNIENEDIPNYRAIHYEEYIPHLINYVKMLNEKIEAQESRINQLEEEIKILKGDK